MADATQPSLNQSLEKQREELATLEAHDADIPTSDPPPFDAVKSHGAEHGPNNRKSATDPMSETPQTDNEDNRSKAPLNTTTIASSSPKATVATDNDTPHSRDSSWEKEADLESGNHGSSSSSKEAQDTEPTVVDPNIVDWDGPNDPHNAMNWSKGMKSGNIAILASITFLTYDKYY